MNKEEYKFFLNKGFIIKKNVLSLKECKSFKNILQKSIIKENKFHKKNNKKNPDYGMVMACPLYDEKFWYLLDNKKLMTAINYILGKNSIVYAFTSSSMPPKSSNFSNRIHNDNPNYIKNYILRVGCTIALDDFTINNGATSFMPGSHKRNQKPTKNEFKKKSIRFLAKAGDVLFFNANLYHRGEKNITLQWRHALTINFTRHWAKQRFNFPELLKKKKKENNFNQRILQKLNFFSNPPKSYNEYYKYKGGLR